MKKDILLSVHKLKEKPSLWSTMTALKMAPGNYTSRGKGGMEKTYLES